MEKNIKNIRQQFKADGVFYTPPELAETLREYVDFTPSRVYDPTVGQGNLLSVFGDDVEKYGQELYQDELDKATERLKNFHGYCGDTLADDGFPNEKFDLIVANYPFSIKWTPNPDDIRWQDAPTIPTAGKADYAFLLHILYHLADKGKAICVCFPGILYRGQREKQIRQWMCEKNYIERVVSIPPKTFTDTAIATSILVLNKSKTTTDIIFENREIGKERTVPFDEVKQNDFNLSVSHYVFEEIVVPKVDPFELEMLARRGFITNLKQSIEFSIMVNRIDGIDAEPFIDEIIQTAQQYKEQIRMKKNDPAA